MHPRGRTYQVATAHGTDLVNSGSDGRAVRDIVTPSAAAIANAIGSARAEGVVPSPETLELLERMRTGEITCDEACQVLAEKYQLLEHLKQVSVNDRCSYCPEVSTGVVVTVNGWVHDTCPRCAKSLVDPLFQPCLPDPTGLPRKHRLLLPVSE